MNESVVKDVIDAAAEESELYISMVIPSDIGTISIAETGHKGSLNCVAIT